MELRRPPCRNEDAHEPHGFWAAGYANWVECPGWSQAEADASSLIGEVRKYIRQHQELPEGIALECHPSVPYYLANAIIPGYMEFTGERDPRSPFSQVPVIACPAMAPGAWRMATISRQVFAEGVITQPG